MDDARHLGDRIRWLRDRKGLTQDELAKAVRISRPTLVNIEKGDRKLYHPDTLFKIAHKLGVSVDALIKPNGFDDEGIEDPEIRISIPRNNEQKFKEVLLYILNKIGARPHIGQTVLYKLLYFIDFDYYELYEEQLIGATYIKNTHGPTPRHFKKIVDEMISNGELIEVKDSYFSYPMTKYLPLRDFDPDTLLDRELEVIESVISRLGMKNASQISEYSHGDIPWMATDYKRDIEYELAFYREGEYSQREYKEED